MPNDDGTRTEVETIMVMEAASVARQVACWTALVLMRVDGDGERALELSDELIAIDVGDDYDIDVRTIAAQAIREAIALREGGDL